MDKKAEIGMVGLGVMGRNLLLNMADQGYAVAGYDKDPGQVEALCKEAGDRQVYGLKDMADFVAALRSPRAVMMLVPAGKVVDAVIGDLLPHLEAGDLVIDGGNSFFRDTEERAEKLAGQKIDYLGVGVSGGEEGARHGPSIMPGGSQSAYKRVEPILQAVAAKVNGDPCVTYLGPRGAGHYVKMVHNGIEYGIMQLIAESYDLLKRGLGLNNDQLHDVYSRWNAAELDSYLVEITAHIFQQKDEESGGRLIDLILDEAKQKGTGMWTSQNALQLQVPVPTVDIAVVMRNMSALKEERRAAADKLQPVPAHGFQGQPEPFIKQVRESLYAGMILTYAQGMALLREASAAYEYDLPLAAIARIWRGGCIIRSALLEDIRAAYHARPDLPNLLMNKALGQRVLDRQESLRALVQAGASLGIPVPAFSTALAYFDSYRSAWLPANLIQAQRDYFGSHTYERIDRDGTFHTEWNGR